MASWYVLVGVAWGQATIIKRFFYTKVPMKVEVEIPFPYFFYAFSERLGHFKAM